MIYNFIVSNDKLSLQEQRNAISGNANFYQCRFVFVDCIDNIKWYCVFRKNDNSYVVEIENNECMIPESVLKDKGIVYVGVFGTSDEDDFIRISTNLIYISIENGAYCSGETPPKPTPDFWEMLYKKIQTLESGKVDKETGKGLSTNDFTDEEKEKLKGLSNYDDEELRTLLNGNVSLLENRLYNKVDKVQGKGLSSNDFTDEDKSKLSELPSKTELDKEFQDDRDYLAVLNNKSDELAGVITDVNGRVQELQQGAEYIYNKTTALNIDSTDEQYPSAKCVYDELVKKEDSSNKTTGIYSGSTDEQYPSAKAVYDKLVKKANKQSSDGGFEGGKGANAATGGAVGKGANADTGGAVGEDAHAMGGGAVGEGTLTFDGFAGGYMAKTFTNMPIDAIQLGTGTNPNEKTLQIYDYQLMDADGHIPNDRIPTKADKTTVSASTEATPSITLSDNTEARCGELTSLTVTLPETLSDSFISSVVFKSGTTATTVTVPSDVYCQGADCKNGAFLPKANKRYTMIFSYDGIMNCYIAAVPIQTSETQSEDVTEDEVTVADNETAAETSESAEEETEPNEVI